MTNNIEEQIMAAVERHDSAQFNALLEKLPAESINADRWSEILSQYVSDSDMPCVDMLCRLKEQGKIKYPQRYNLYCSDSIDVCVMQEAAQQSTDIMRRILDCGFDVDAHDEAGTCALSIATEEDNQEMIKLLLEYGADPDMAHPYMEEDEEYEEDEEV